MTRYARQTMLPEIGDEGQRRLRAARVLVVGAGGLGSPVLLYLAGAGVGRIGIVDNDVVSLTNLHRQVLYTECDLDMPKAECAARRLRDMNRDAIVEPYVARLEQANAREIVARYDLVIDACDNVATRYLLDDVTAEAGIPYVYGAICGFEGQVSVFNCGERPRRYRDLWPDEQAMLRTDAPKGVVGVTPAVVGSVEAGEALKLICGYGETLAGRLWTIDLRTMQAQIFELP